MRILIKNKCEIVENMGNKKTNPNITVFNKYAKEYDEWYNDNKTIYELELGAIKKFIPKSDKEKPEKKKIGLEIGVGTGRFAEPLGIEYGLEPSKSMAEIAKKRGIKVYEGIAENIPFKDEFFDYVLMTTTLCFLKEPIKGLSEIKRVLKSNGTLIIGMIDKDSPLGRFYESKKEKSRFYKNVKFYSLNEVLNWLEELEYKNIKYNRVKLNENDDKGSFVVICAKK
jgi:ubiquinone/menaquinone biosynthesis C-methylase UbiE